MFGIGETELVLILLFAFLVFGPDKLPGMGRTLGRALRQFQNAQEGFNKVVRADLLDPAADALHEKPKRSEQLKNAASDADREDTDHQETFAERRARLKEEREAAEKAAAEAAEQSKQTEQTQEAEQPEAASAEEALAAAPQASSSIAFSDDSTEVTEHVDLRLQKKLLLLLHLQKTSITLDLPDLLALWQKTRKKKLLERREKARTHKSSFRV